MAQMTKPAEIEDAPADAVVVTNRHATAGERAAAGRAARKAAPRASHAEYAPAAKRRDPIDVIEAQSATRVPELVPIRYGRMTESPFRFYRGATAIMAMDLAHRQQPGTTGRSSSAPSLLPM